MSWKGDKDLFLCEDLISSILSKDPGRVYKNMIHWSSIDMEIYKNTVKTEEKVKKEREYEIKYYI